MPSIKPKIQGYVDSEIYTAFQQWKAERGIEGMSDALNEFLKIYLGFEKPLPATGGLGKEEIEALIEEECEIRLREIKEDIASRLPSIPEIIAKAEAQAQSWMDRNSEEWMHRLGEQFYKRIYTLERKVQTIDWWLSREEPGIYQPLEPEIEEESLEVPETEESKGDYEESPLEEPEEESKWNSPFDEGDTFLWWEEEVRVERIGRATLYCHYTKDPTQEKNRVYTRVPFEEAEKIKLEMRSPQEPPEEDPPLSSLEQEDLEANPLPIPPQSPEPPPISIRLTGLKQSELERRLKISKGTLTKRRDRPDFKEWSRGHDPDKIGWQWDAIARKYLAVE